MNRDHFSTLWKKRLDRHSWIIGSGIIYLVLIFARDWKALNRIGADTGYSYVPDADLYNLWVLFKPFPEYFEISGRAIAEIVVIFPIRYHAIASSSVVNLVWVLLALMIAIVVAEEAENRIVASLAGLVLILIPHAMESSLGNIGMIKFPMTAAAAIAFCSSRSIDRFSKSLTVFSFLVGLSQPILFVTTIPLLWHLRTCNKGLRRKVVTILIVVASTFLIQLFKVGMGAAINGRGSSSVRYPWQGMGMFWYSGLFFPIICATFVIAVSTVKPFRDSSLNQMRWLLGISTVSLALSSYLLGGIADRYFVAPMTLAWIAGVLLLYDGAKYFGSIGKLAILIAVILALVPTVKWFQAGWFLTSGPTWTSEVDKARILCEINPEAIVELRVSPTGSASVECDQLVSN